MDSQNNIRPLSILIPDGGNYDSVKVLYCLSRVPEVTVNMLSRAKRPMARFSRHCANFKHHTSRSDKAWVDVIKDTASKWGVDVILPVTPRGIELISRNCETISQVASIVPVARPEQIEMANDKWMFYQFLKRCGLPVAPTLYIGTAGDTIPDSTALDSISYPALLKPTSRMSGYGIVKVKSSSDCYQAWNDKNHIINGDRYILQRFVQGVDYSLSVCCRKGDIIAYSLYKVILPCKRHFGTGRVLEFVHNEKIIDVGRKVLSAMEWEGVANIDFVVGKLDQSVNILDFNPRFWRTILGSMFAGVNFPFIWCLSSIGINLPSSQREGARYASSSQYVETLIARLINRNGSKKVGLKESGLRSTIEDPLPELVNTFRLILRKLHEHDFVNH